MSLVEDYQVALRAHLRAVDALVPLTIRMAQAAIAALVPGAHHLEVRGELTEDGLPTLHLERVLNKQGDVLLDVALVRDVATDNAIALAEQHYLDALLDLTGDEYMGPSEVHP